MLCLFVRTWQCSTYEHKLHLRGLRLIDNAFNLLGVTTEATQRQQINFILQNVQSFIASIFTLLNTHARMIHLISRYNLRNSDTIQTIRAKRINTIIHFYPPH